MNYSYKLSIGIGEICLALLDSFNFYFANIIKLDSSFILIVEF